MPTLTILHGCRTIQLTQGFNTLVNDSVFQFVGSFKWYAARANKRYYAVRRTKAKEGLGMRAVLLHRVLINTIASVYVDHKNGDSLDNRHENLRPATHGQNKQNQRKSTSASGFKGVVSLKGQNLWQACVFVNGLKIHLGTFASPKEAARAYDSAAKKHFGEFACTNADIYGDY